ncbi:MAG TPA: GTP-binding protein [Candidatus Omnitrophota bacterium]|nr:GTP-binding protein [Candidatus Omnitrophota bacterium]
MDRERMNIVIAGHVDHGKSTVIGRLLSDTGSLPRGKLEQVKAMCEKNAKPFEYAFLLDALKDEQNQGITIDAARCFFKTRKRDYIVIDAPGHVEFLKNMITGAARAEAALLVIDAKEGILENSKRHGYLLSMIGVEQVSVLVNKMDLAGYDENIFLSIKSEYEKFLRHLNIRPISFIPVSARESENIVTRSDKMPWYQGTTVLEQLDSFGKSGERSSLPFRFPVQDIYKFTEAGDDRRIVAGTVETGRIRCGEEVIFLPSRKRSVIQSVEMFNSDLRDSAEAGEAVGFTLMTQVYIKPGELMVKVSEPLPVVSFRFKANIFWMGKAPLIKRKKYKLKIGSNRVSVELVQVLNVLDASDLTSIKNKQQADRYDVAECVFETAKPVAFDKAGEIRESGRFVLVDNYEIAGAGIILEDRADQDSILKEHVLQRESLWEKSSITHEERAAVYRHKAKFVVFTGPQDVGKQKIARALERKLFEQGHKVYYLGIANIVHGLDSDLANEACDREEAVRRLGELARILTDSGQIFIATISDADDYDINALKTLNAPNDIFTIGVGGNNFDRFKPDADLERMDDTNAAVEKVCRLLKEKEVLLEYHL